MKIQRHPKHDEWAAFVCNHRYGSPFQHPDCFALFNTFGKLKPVSILHYDIDDYIDGVISAYPCSYVPSAPICPHALISVNAPLTDYAFSKSDQQIIQKDLTKAIVEFKGFKRPVMELRQMNGMDITPGTTKYGLKHLNLIKDISSPEMLLQDMTNSRWRCIRKITRDGFHTELVASNRDLQPFIKILQRHYSKLKKPFISPEVIKGIATTTSEQNSFRVVVSKKGNKVCGGAILGFCRDTCYEWYIVSDKSVKNSGTAVTYGAMEFAMKAGYKKFDFMGIGRSDVEYGVRKFKLGFGGEVVAYRRDRV